MPSFAKRITDHSLRDCVGKSICKRGGHCRSGMVAQNGAKSRDGQVHTCTPHVSRSATLKLESTAFITCMYGQIWQPTSGAAWHSHPAWHTAICDFSSSALQLSHAPGSWQYQTSETR
eukprot:1160387-Pelagomonas_calceolata.AAC.7